MSTGTAPVVVVRARHCEFPTRQFGNSMHHTAFGVERAQE